MLKDSLHYCLKLSKSSCQYVPSTDEAFSTKPCRLGTGRTDIVGTLKESCKNLQSVGFSCDLFFPHAPDSAPDTIKVTRQPTTGIGKALNAVTNSMTAAAHVLHKGAVYCKYEKGKKNV